MARFALNSTDIHYICYAIKDVCKTERNGGNWKYISVYTPQRGFKDDDVHFVARCYFHAGRLERCMITKNKSQKMEAIRTEDTDMIMNNVNLNL